ncbi:DNA polymerase III subunit beta [Sessilibacter corallicola]|uniref:Beta sliding clamp n=1 Tax=Sessilibacter corallicola TaxID=2904075 RepID=A0ABQ0ABH9_9GAMM|nr:DNA polymerase III subunit beta [Sessilibacter corallicola]MCE2028039.1 DNA polymerase III subunit beta [Sessilibacter corallicola]
MKFKVIREQLLKPLQLVVGVIEKRQTMPILSNVYMSIVDGILSLTGTDMEVEMVVRIQLTDNFEEGEITIPAKKLADICRSLPDESEISVELKDERVLLKSGRSRFQLSTLPASDYPITESGSSDVRFQCSKGTIKRLIDKTGFAMAQQDVRYYLNGMLWEITSDRFRAVSTDGHRLALCENTDVSVGVSDKLSCIVPRKGIMELSRLLDDSEDSVEVSIGATHVQVSSEHFTFTSKLVDGKFPEYERVLPKGGDKIVFGPRSKLKESFSRAAILSNEKYRGVRLYLTDGLLSITANNPEQEEANEEVVVDYQGEELEIGFNVSYLQDVTNVIDSDSIKLTLANPNASALIEEPEGGDCLYVVMPMRM